ncbi:unnamed protein product [Caenorhabditis bovis]|uniref:Bestrophin homolog n=1 Tax=Caenorhabditis bovis TaxID=2654633 RepID=A0A8S1EPE0_9PELO|nr:unnamed protein product [Caenorhabditis bovis]
MTVNYQLDVASGSPALFLKLLTRWRGSVWKSVIGELIIWLAMFYALYFSYRYAFSENLQRIFEDLSVHFDDRLKYIPLTFMLGFFVTTVFERWRSALNVMPFIESVALSVAVLISGIDDEARKIRRTIIRYVVLHQVLIFRDISMMVRRRFPTLQYVVDAGFMEPEELDIFDSVNIKPGQKYFVPINWANSLALEAHQNKFIEQPVAFNNVIFAIKEFRVAMETLTKFDQIPIPIGYPQVVFLATRAYFLICIVSRQFLIQGGSETQMDWPIPIMTIFEFVFIMGWMKVAEVLLNPLGEDDDDFEVNWIIDKNIATGMAIVDDTHAFHPNMKVDKFADPNYLPQYAPESQLPRTLTGSAAKVELAPSNEAVKMVRVTPEDAIPTTERAGTQPSRKAYSLRKRSKSIDIESPPKLTLSTPSNSPKVPDRPTLATLSEERRNSNGSIASTDSKNTI